MFAVAWLAKTLISVACFLVFLNRHNYQWFLPTLRPTDGSGNVNELLLDSRQVDDSKMDSILKLPTRYARIISTSAAKFLNFRCR
jgi:hypothetical protein